MKPRRVERYWPTPGINASFKGKTSTGTEETLDSRRIWDISEQNCGLELKCAHEFIHGNTGELKFTNDSDGITVSQAKIERIWEGGMALSFGDDPSLKKFFRGLKKQGHSHNEEFDRKKGLALIEIQELSNDVRQLKDCQMRLFFTCFTLSIGLASLLAVLHQMQVGALQKTIVSISPAVISVVFGFLSIQKTIQKNRKDSFLLHLQQQFDQACFFPQYRGWQDAFTNIKNCKHLKCFLTPSCMTDAKRMIRDIPLNKRLRTQCSLFDLIVFIIYFGIFFTSLVVTFFWFISHQETSYVFTLGIVATLITVIPAVFEGVMLYQAWVGNSSFLAYYQIWNKLLQNCVPFQTENLLQSS